MFILFSAKHEQHLRLSFEKKSTVYDSVILVTNALQKKLRCLKLYFI
jgi:hypothetical protein